MKLKITHLTHYHYEKSVTLGIHDFFLIPQEQAFQTVLSSDLLIHPQPMGKAERRDFIGNSYVQAWFAGETQSMEVKSEILVDCIKFNPFAFIVDPTFLKSNDPSGDPRFIYAPDIQPVVAAFIHGKVDSVLSTTASGLFEQSSDLLDFLVKITANIHENWEHLIREEEDIWAPEFTFSRREGSCRDLAWMEMNLLGTLGLASRFVSGYAYNPELEEGHELHAWLETYLPGAGWIGLDPSLGLLTNELYIPLAFHPNPQLTLPVQGKYGGLSGSKLDTHVQIQQIKD
jgi:transglutaminase-like putative cysteine protease